MQLLGTVLWRVSLLLEACSPCSITKARFHHLSTMDCRLLSCCAAEPSLVLSPDCKHLAVKEPCSKRICLLSAQDGFKDVLTTLVPQPVSLDGERIADTVLSCSWSADSSLLLVACKSSAVYLYGR